MKAHKGVDIQIHIFLTSALVGGDWSASRPSRFTPGERAPGTHWKGGWLSPKTGLEDVEKRKVLTLLGLKLRSPCRAACSQLLYRLRYPGSSHHTSTLVNLIPHSLHSCFVYPFSFSCCLFSEALPWTSVTLFQFYFIIFLVSYFTHAKSG
jgi:hypothetical protein